MIPNMAYRFVLGGTRELGEDVLLFLNLIITEHATETEKSLLVEWLIDLSKSTLSTPDYEPLGGRTGFDRASPVCPFLAQTGIWAGFYWARNRILRDAHAA